MYKKKVLIITGPTASGKTDISICCAKKFNGEIISCDSMQIYKDLDIGTAKITEDEKENIPHYLINTVNSDEEFSVQQYSKLANERIEEIIKKNKLPILVGGTGLYIKSIMYPYSFCNAPKNEKIRKKYQDILEKNGKEFLYNLLKEIDLESALKININDTKRVIRALEIFEVSKNIKSNMTNDNKINSKYEFIFVVLNLDREDLYNRINKRVDKMFENGLIEELKNVLSKNHKLNKDCQSMQAIGYRELFDLFENKTTLEETKSLIKQHTRNYAKRQITFIKSFKEAIWFNPLTEKDKIFNYIEKQINN